MKHAWPMGFGKPMLRKSHPVLGRFYFPGILSCIGLVIVLLATCAHAQQQMPQQAQPKSLVEQVLASRYNAELNKSLSCETNMLEAQVKIKELEAQLATIKKDDSQK